MEGDEIMNEKLKPCPFCGSKNLIFGHSYHERDNEYYYIECAKCGATTINNCYREYSIYNWNSGKVHAKNNSLNIKHCPFCGHEITYHNIFFGGNRSVYFLSCPECHAQIGDHWKGDYGDAEEAIAAWNTRAEAQS